MSELVDSIKEAQAIENEKAKMEADVEAGNVVEPKAIHSEKVETEEYKTLGQSFLESDAYKSFRETGIKNVKSELKYDPRVELKTTVTETTWPPVRIAISSSIAFLLSPKPGAFTATTFNPPLNLLTTKVAKASPSTSSEIIIKGLPA